MAGLRTPFHLSRLGMRYAAHDYSKFQDGVYDQ